jgi:branched-chain amino acid transport system permease protein
MEYVIWVAVITELFIILSTSLNLTVGVAGVLSLAHAAFYGIGAYCSALLSKNMGTPFWFNVLMGSAFAGLFGLLLGVPSLKLRGDYMAIATLGFGEIIRVGLNNWESFTGGAAGIAGIPRPSLFGFRFDSPERYLILVSFFTVISVIIIYRIANSPFGRILKAIRDDPVAAEALGKNTTYYRIVALVIGSVFAGMTGTLYACYITFIHPSNFTLFESIFVLCMVVLGGMGSIKGSVIGAIVLVTLPELLRFIGIPSGFVAPCRQILYSIALIFLMLFRPRGIWGESDITKS